MRLVIYLFAAKTRIKWICLRKPVR